MMNGTGTPGHSSHHQPDLKVAASHPLPRLSAGRPHVTLTTLAVATNRLTRLCSAILCHSPSKEPVKTQGKKLVFVTNNSTKSRKGYLGKFTSLGLDVSAEEIYSSSYAAAAYLESINFPKDKKVPAAPVMHVPDDKPFVVQQQSGRDCVLLSRVTSLSLGTRTNVALGQALQWEVLAMAQVYIVGEVGIVEELELKGIQHIGGPEDADKKIELKPGFALPHDESVRRQPPLLVVFSSLDAWLLGPRLEGHNACDISLLCSRSHHCIHTKGAALT